MFFCLLSVMIPLETGRTCSPFTGIADLREENKMDWMYLFFFLLAALIFFGAKYTGRGKWNDEYTSLGQVKMLQGISALGIVLHHMAQRTCAPWIPSVYIRHGLDSFVSIGYMLVGVFLFCSGFGLYRSYQSKPDYLKGFFRRRILPVILAFYLSEWIYTAARLLAGEKMDFMEILWYLSGLHMANPDTWYVVVIPFFYLVFRMAFRFCKREGTAIFWVFLFTAAYTVLGACIEHQNDWWMRGEWWYNSILLFPLGLVFGKHRDQITKGLKKGYWFWLLLSAAAVVLLFLQSEWLNNNAWGYYSSWRDPMRIPKRLMSAGMQWLTALAYVMFCFLVLLKVKIGNKALAWLGTMTLDLYLMQRLFVDLFGYNFLDTGKIICYIRDIPLYTAAVLASAAAAAVMFRWLRLRLTGWICGGRKAPPAGVDGGPRESEALRRARKKAAGPGKAVRILRKWFWPAAGVLLLAAVFFFSRQTPDRTFGGVVVSPPDGFAVQSSDSRYTVWKCAEENRKVSTLVLDTGIRGEAGQRFSTAEEVLESCDWMTERELYVNPQGIRMVRGFSSQGNNDCMRRYYVETKDAVILLSMVENEQFYDTAACEEAIRQAADSIRPV